MKLSHWRVILMCCFSWETISSDSFKVLKNHQGFSNPWWCLKKKGEKKKKLRAPEHLQTHYCMWWSFVFFPACIATLIRNSPSIENQPCCGAYFNKCRWPRTFERIHQRRASQGKSCCSRIQLTMSGRGAEMEGCWSLKLNNRVLTKIVVLGKPSKAAAGSLPLFGVWSPYGQTVSLAVQPCQDLG